MGAGCSITAAVTAAATAATSATEAMWIHQQACALVRDDLSGTATWLHGELSWWRPSAPWTNQPANGPVRAVTPWVWMDMEIQLQVQRVTSYPIARQAFVSRFVKGCNDNLKANKSTETPHQSCLAAPQHRCVSTRSGAVLLLRTCATRLSLPLLASLQVTDRGTVRLGPLLLRPRSHHVPFCSRAGATTSHPTIQDLLTPD